MATNSKVESTIKKIEGTYSLGEILIKQSPEELTHGVTDTLAEIHGLSASKVRSFRHLADKKRGFNRDELDELYEEFRLEGRCLSLSHLIRSLAITKKEDRKNALILALKGKMSANTLQDFITSKQPNSKGAGRKPKAIKVQNFSTLVGSMVWSWNRQLTEYLKVNHLTSPGLNKAVREMQGMMDLVIKLSDYEVKKPKKKRSSLFDFG